MQKVDQATKNEVKQ